MVLYLLPLLALLSLHPAVPGWAALVTGVILALVWGNPHAATTKRWTPRLLAYSVVGLGAGMNLVQVARVGMQGFAYTLVGIVAAMALGTWLGRRFRVEGDTSLLISVGTAICGGSAIAAVAPVIRAREEEVSVSLATVFLLNAAALLIFPPVGHALHLDQRAFGLWSALAIHDTSSVVGAASSYGHQAELVATTTKLARALWIVPLTLALGFWHGRQRTQEDEPPRPPARRPWFILGFLAAAALVTFVPALAPAGRWVSAIARRSLVLTLFLLGCGISRQALRHVGLKPLLQGVALWALVGGGTLALILKGWIA